MGYQLTNNDIVYGYVVDETEDEEVETVEVIKKEFKLNIVASN
jgi:hypothetical protein